MNHARSTIDISGWISSASRPRASMNDRTRVATTASGRRAGWAWRVGVAWVAVLTGCASVDRLPSNFELDAAELVSDPTPPALLVDGFSGKGSAAGVGAVKGGGTGAAVGTVACLGTGPFFPLCVVAVVPATAAIGAVGWATAAAVTSEDADAVASKLDLLKSRLPSNAASSTLATHLQAAAQQRFGAALPLQAVPASSDAARPASTRPWRIEVALNEVAFEDNKPGRGYALRLQGRMRIRRDGQADGVYEKSLVVRSGALHTTDEWRANEASALTSGYELNLRQMADEMLSELMRQTPDKRRRAGG